MNPKPNQPPIAAYDPNKLPVVLTIEEAEGLRTLLYLHETCTGTDELNRLISTNRMWRDKLKAKELESKRFFKNPGQ
ncbi:hypothetical protein [Salmonirosea aquatica]|uniref:Uncharacterized protein n=1 Tax=Salmonirosea aquatica TaxID=2654236 RepID=A0A7C9FRT7_9BACT|nr:hypothetical protein [Cytophagaceae bacterium SJW1-29]